jgi:hypothetical protein
VSDADLKNAIVVQPVLDDDRLEIAYRLFNEICERFPDRIIALVDPHNGHILARSDNSRQTARLH